MKSIISKFCVYVLPVLLIFSFSVNAECDSWYFIRSGHNQPQLAPEFSYLEKYGGFYLDRDAKDTDKVIYLTFDAGYENGNVSKIVDILDENKVHGTFFILENLAIREPELIKKMSENGHTVANHTATHPDLSHSSEKEIESEIRSLEKTVYEKTGVEVAKLFRPPEGKLSEQELKAVYGLGYKTIMWSFAYAEWDNSNQPNPEAARQKILDNTHNGMVILIHPTSETNVKILDGLIKEWENQGYRIGDIDELTENK